MPKQDKTYKKTNSKKYISNAYKKLLKNKRITKVNIFFYYLESNSSIERFNYIIKNILLKIINKKVYS